MERGLSKNELISQLTRSPHGKLEEYLPVGQRAAREEPEFLARLVSWNRTRGQIRDSKTALPIVGLSVGSVHPEFASNHLAHFVSLDVRNMVKALRFSKTIKTPGYERQIRRAAARWLAALESNWAKWERTAVQHRHSLASLYALLHFKPTRALVGDILFDRQFPKGSLFEVISNLGKMSPLEAAGTILERKIPFLIAKGALGSNADKPDVVMALMSRMTPTELTTNMKALERLGVKTNPILRAALDEGLKRAAKGTTNVLKATAAAEALGDDKPLADKLRAVQEKQIDAHMSVEGDWLVLADRSPSMDKSIEIAKEVAAILARVAKGKVHLIFFDSTPRYMDMTGKTYDEIKKETKHVTAGGSGTSIACGLLHMLDRKIDVDGIAIVSDGGENRLNFADTYKAYTKAIDKQTPVYFYHVAGDTDVFSTRMRMAELDFQEFDLRGGTVDQYSLGNIVATMRTNRFGLIDEIMQTPLLDLDVLLPQKEVVMV